jgi:hypothetical protein
VHGHAQVGVSCIRGPEVTSEGNTFAGWQFLFQLLVHGSLEIEVEQWHFVPENVKNMKYENPD